LPPGSTATPLSLPLGHLLLHVIDDETDVVDHRALRAPGPRRISERQIDQNAGEPDGLGVAALDQFAAHAEKNLLVGFRVLRGEVPVAHGHACLVERGGLRVGRACCKCRREQQS
jgi:hypothetical protein